MTPEKQTPAQRVAEPTDALVERVRDGLREHGAHPDEMCGECGKRMDADHRPGCHAPAAISALTELAERLKAVERERDHWKQEVEGLASEQRVAEQAVAQRDAALAAAEQVPQLVEALEIIATDSAIPHAAPAHLGWLARRALAKHRDPYGHEAS